MVVLDVSDQQVEVLRIEENLRRRGLKTSETVRAIRRLYELHGITEKGGRPAKENPADSAGFVPKTQEDVARDAGVSPRQAQVFNRLADLIPELMQLRDAGTITQAVAYQLAQLPGAPPVPRPARGPALERVGPWATARSLWAGPVRLHDNMPAHGADAWVGLRFLTQRTGHALGVSGQIVVLHDPHRARGAAPPRHTVTVAPLARSAPAAAH